MNKDIIGYIDINGNKVSAHGGIIIFYQNKYYWYGEDRRNNGYIRCYCSTSLKDWEDLGLVISTETLVSSKSEYRLINDDGTKVNLERPKVIFNKKTKQFVMWMHYENGKDYSLAMAAVAVSSYPDHGFEFKGAFRPLGYMSRDCTLFQDDDKTYFISASNDNADLHIYQLSDDYLSIDKLVQKLFIGKYREAPSLVKIDNIYYMLTSYCTGWLPNQCQYSYATSIEGKWSELINIGNYNTFHSQPAFIIKINEVPYYFGDCWGGTDWEKIEDFDYNKSSYLSLELEVKNNRIDFKI